MKKILLIISSLVLIIILASCVSNNLGNTVEAFNPQAAILVNEGDPVPLKLTDGTQVGTVTAFIPTGRINVVYMSDYRLELVDEKLYTADGVLYNRYYSSNPPDRYSFDHWIEKPYISDSTFLIMVWVSDGCDYYQAFAEFKIGLGSPSLNSSITVNSTRTQIVEYDWTIEKSADQTDFLMELGGTKLVNYTINVNKGDPQVTTEGYILDGVLEVSSVPPGPIVINSIDLYFGYLAIPGDDTSFVQLITKPITPTAALVYPYSWDLTGVATSSDVDYWILANVLTDLGSTQALTGPFRFDQAQVIEEIDETALVEDLIDDSLVGPFTHIPIGHSFPATINVSTEFQYTVEIIAPQLCEENGYLDNIATVTELDTDENASAAWSLYFFTPECEVEVLTNITATPYSEKIIEYDWTIEKIADKSAFMMNLGETVSASYVVTVTKGDPQVTIEGYMLDGILEISTVPPSPIVINSINLHFGYLTIPGDNNSFVPLAPPKPITPTAALIYPYSWDLTGIATDTNVDYWIRADVGTDLGPSQAFAGPFTFANALLIDEIDETARVDDLIDDSLIGLFTYNPVGYPFPAIIDTSTVFQYIIEITAPELCRQEGWLDNVATVTELDTGEFAEDDWSLYFYTCDELGCTRTQGYWKNHTEYWIGHHPDDPFFSSGQTWIEAFSQDPGEADAYYILAKQYMAAKLNIANGAAVPSAVSDTLADSEEWFSTNSNPPPVNPNTPKGQQLLDWKNILDAYNNGWNYPALPGWPPHCDD